MLFMRTRAIALSRMLMTSRVPLFLVLGDAAISQHMLSLMGVIFRAQEMQGNVWLLPDHPAIMAWRNRKQITKKMSL